MGIKIFRFHARLIGTVSETVWQQARAMNALWNELLEKHQQFLEEIKPLYENRQNKEQIKNRWYAFDEMIVQISRSNAWKEKLGWGAREAVLERFRTASKKTLKENGTMRLKPSRILKISFYHRFTEGGLPTERIFNNRSQKLKLTELPEEIYQDESYRNRRSRYSAGFFGLGIDNESLPISVYLHRQIPDGKLKTAHFVGKFDEMQRKWSWSLLLAVDVREITEIRAYKPAAALDLNWRRIDDYLRIGFLKDSAGNSFEVRLPLEAPASRRAKNLLKSINGKRRARKLSPLELKDLFPLNILEIDEWQKRADNLKDRVKIELRKIYQETNEGPLPKHADEFIKSSELINRRGLLKLQWQISELETPSDADRQAKAILDEWQPSDHRLRLSVHQCYKYLANKRKKIYENLTLWLKSNYSYLIWEGDLSLKKLATLAKNVSMNDSKQVSLKLGNRYRQYAGLSFLREMIKHHDRDGWLISVKMANTTRICRICKETCEVSAARLIQCPKGHIVDQDDNSCVNMLEKIDDDLIYVKKREKLVIPPQLERYVVPIITEG